MQKTPRGLARQVSLFSALVLAAAGCGGHRDVGSGGGHSPTTAPSTPPTSANSSGGTYWLTLYWSFARHVHGQADVGYDLDTAPGGSSGACAQSGVDTVVVSDASGAALGSGVDCVYGGVQGASFPGFTPGTYDLTVTGYRDGVALYQTAISADVTTSGADTYAVTVEGIPDDLDILASLVEAHGTLTTCWNPADTLTFELVDSAGTRVDQGWAACSADGVHLYPQAGVSLSGTDAPDRDRYAIRLQEVDPQGGVVFDSTTPPACADPVIDHLGADTGNGVVVELQVPTAALCP